MTHWPPFVTATIEDLGIIGEDSPEQLLEKTRKQFKEIADATIKNIINQSEKILNDAKKLSLEIEGKARKTATKISVKAAQDEFNSAQVDIKKDVII